MTERNEDNLVVLRRMQSKGDDLVTPCDVDFSVVFPREHLARSFVSQLGQSGYKVSMEFSEVVEGLPWDVCVTKRMAPSLQGIGEFEALLEELARPLQGRNDGWGCFTLSASSA